MCKSKCVVWLILAVAALVGVAGAQDDLSFLTEQVCVIDSGSTTTYWVIANNYAQSHYDWYGPYTAATALSYSLPVNEWVGMFIYNEDAGAYMSGQYNIRYGAAAMRSDAVIGDTLLASASSALGFSASSSQVVAGVNSASAWLLAFNFTQATQAWTELPVGASVSTTITLGNAQEWVGCYLYDQVSGQWDDDSYFSLWDSFGN